ncbi:MAG: carbon storage regulator CsrA [Pirellulales bacterium]
MVVLPRKRGESIIINDNIEVVVVDIRGDKVRLGIKHPPDVSVHRYEIYEAIKRASLNVSDSNTDEIERK